MKIRIIYHKKKAEVLHEQKDGIQISHAETGNFVVLSYYNYYESIMEKIRYIPISQIKEIQIINENKK